MTSKNKVPRRLTDAELADFDRLLREGMNVRALWRDNLLVCRHGEAVIEKVNLRSVRVRLAAPVVDLHGRLVADKGTALTIPRLGSSRWSRRKCVLPKE